MRDADRDAQDVSDKALRRLLRQRRLADLIARGPFRNSVVVDRSGEILAGDPARKAGSAQDLAINGRIVGQVWGDRSEEHTSELQSLMRISYAVFCLKKHTTKQPNQLT